MTFKNIAIAAAIAMTALGASAQTGKSPFFAEIGYAALNYSEPGYSAPRVTIAVASLEPGTLGAAMKEISGTLRTIIQGPGSSSAVAA